MGTLVAMHYRTTMFAKLADHTYVKCDTGGAAWKCWGGKTGGKKLRSGAGSTKRADKIAQPDEKANIKCYLINGVCHQAANRILLPAGITVRGARGYSVSQALFGTYGRVGIWPCSSPFQKYPTVSGDLQECVRHGRRRTAATRSLDEADKLDWQFIQGELAIYKEATAMLRARSVRRGDANRIHMKLFMHMAEFNLGPMLDKSLASTLRHVRKEAEKERVGLEQAFSGDEMDAREFVDTFDAFTLKFQDEMANALKPAEYETLFEATRDDRVTLADPKIVKKVYGA